MASIIKKLDKQTGVTYVYESESYWDKEKKQPRSKRKLIGKIDEQTGEIVPTSGRKGRKRKELTQIPQTAGTDGNTLRGAGRRTAPEGRRNIRAEKADHRTYVICQ